MKCQNPAQVALDAEHGVLLKGRAKRIQIGRTETQKPDHSASLSDSVTASTRMRFSVHTGSFYQQATDRLIDADPELEVVVRVFHSVYGA